MADARLVDSIRPGDRVTIVNRFGQPSTGRAVMPAKGGIGWVLNMGGAHGTPGIATDENVVKVSPAKRGSTMVSKHVVAELVSIAKELVGGKKDNKLRLHPDTAKFLILVQNGKATEEDRREYDKKHPEGIAFIKDDSEKVSAETFKCPDCGAKVLTNTGYCLTCKKKVSPKAASIEAGETFKCPDCGAKVLTNTGYCLTCKKKVAPPAGDKEPAKEDKAPADDKK
jgi:DNA-directed RNA polymerase subunit RPC12/RpoP